MVSESPQLPCVPAIHPFAISTPWHNSAAIKGKGKVRDHEANIKFSNSTESIAPTARTMWAVE
jgi:hypothetical protein